MRRTRRLYAGPSGGGGGGSNHGPVIGFRQRRHRCDVEIWGGSGNVTAAVVRRLQRSRYVITR